MIDGDEDGSTELNRLGGVIENIYCGRTTADVRFAFEDGNVDGVGGGEATYVMGS